MPTLIEDLKECLIPFWNIESHRMACKQINPFYDKFDGRLFFRTLSEDLEFTILPRGDEKDFILNYILMITFGI